MAGLGIYHYGARFYSPYINRFLNADTIVPGYANPQSLNRYSYVLNSPLKYTDPTGHKPCSSACISQPRQSILITMQAEDPYESSDGTCSAGDTSCNWVGNGNGGGGGNSNNDHDDDDPNDPTDEVDKNSGGSVTGTKTSEINRAIFELVFCARDM